MPRYSKLSQTSVLRDGLTITPNPILDFLAPVLYKPKSQASGNRLTTQRCSRVSSTRNGARSEAVFYSVLSRAATCRAHQTSNRQRNYLQSVRHFSSRGTSVQNKRLDRQASVKSVGGGAQDSDQRSRQSLEGQQDLERTRAKLSERSSKVADPGFFNCHTQDSAASSYLPKSFFGDLEGLRDKIATLENQKVDEEERQTVNIKAQLNLLQSVRELEAKLAKAKVDLQQSMTGRSSHHVKSPGSTSGEDLGPISLSKEDYLGLVDLYYYTHKNRFTPESPDSSPTPLFLEDYSFKLSEDFATPDAFSTYYDDEEPYESPLKQLGEMLKSRQIREVSVMQAFVNLLLNDKSSNRALFEVYKKLPEPGVAYLPKGIIRVFLQRMSTPWTKSEKSMLRYLSLIDDMQSAGLPITSSEWSSAIYLAGRSFGKVTDAEISTSFRIWRQMEHEAGVKASNVTFNILFDIAVRASKFVLAETVLKEMHDRGLRLNRLGRVNLIYYHGLRGDGDGVRRTYRDFVEAGEIVDTLVLNCVIASLVNAQEPTAAEQVYERMKNLQLNLRKQRRSNDDVLYIKYPPPGSTHIGREMASNSLGRILGRASRLKALLPQLHKDLQGIMPLRPDHTTFRSMISYHANVSGNLNRITVLMSEMTDLFSLPFMTVNFLLLFKGFALHGGNSASDASWSVNRLDLVWETCRNAITSAQSARQISMEKKRPSTQVLPSASGLEIIDQDKKGSLVAAEQNPKLKRLSTWDDFVLDLAAFPGERRKPIARINAQLFDDEHASFSPFSSSFFQRPQAGDNTIQQHTYYAGGNSALDSEEGEYTLPSPLQSTNPADSQSSNAFDGESTTLPYPSSDDSEHVRSSPHEIRATRPLICWLLRAYTRCTGSRAKVEEVWAQAGRVWRPQDAAEKESVLRVLRRCLRDCDRFGPPIW